MTASVKGLTIDDTEKAITININKKTSWLNQILHDATPVFQP